MSGIEMCSEFVPRKGSRFTQEGTSDNTHLKVQPWFLLWLGSLSGWPRSLNLLLPSFFSESRKRSFHGGAVGRDGAGEGMTGCGWRKE